MDKLHTSVTLVGAGLEAVLTALHYAKPEWMDDRWWWILFAFGLAAIFYGVLPGIAWAWGRARTSMAAAVGILMMIVGAPLFLFGALLLWQSPKNASSHPKTGDIAKEQQQAIIDALKGVGNYFYFALMDKVVVGTDPSGKNLYRWYTVAPKGIVREVNYWISQASKNDPGYWALDQRKPPVTIHGGAFITDRAFPAGDYLIEIDDSNGHWNEWFRVYSQDGQLRQHILIRNPKGEVIFETTDDANFSTP